jgi:alkylation response protein AidB-like acyl-CoA dehydrogenase
MSESGQLVFARRGNKKRVKSGHSPQIFGTHENPLTPPRAFCSIEPRERSMDFAWSEQVRELYERAIAFGGSIAAARAGEPFSRAAWARCGEFGMLGLSAPEAFGGGGLGALATARVVEAFGRSSADGGLVFSASAHLFACVMPIVESASEGVKRAFLPGLTSGELVGANAMTEAGAGSDVAALTTKAVADGDFYVLDGAKSYVTNGPMADVFVVYAATGPSSGYFGLTGFVVPRDTPGVVVGKSFPKIGLHSAPTCEVYFEGARVPRTHRLGEEGQGLPIFQDSMAWERACLFAAYLGAMERDLATTLAFAQERKQFGRPIGKNQAVAHRIVDMKLRLEAARLMLYKACWLADSGARSTLDISLAKLAVSEAAVQSGLDMLRVHGSVGISAESGIARSLLDALPSTVFSGTSEIQRDIVARSMGL